MAYVLDLSSSWAKLERAKEHFNELRAGIAEVCGSKLEIPISRKYEPEQGAIVYRIDSLVQIPDDWELIVGDCVHNMRCALDHLAWQLALRYFNGVEPQDQKTIRQIQFPVISDYRLWPGHPNRKFVTAADSINLEKCQPFSFVGPTPPRSMHLLEALKLFENTDKHRKIELMQHTPISISFTAPDYSEWRDCEPLAIRSDGEFAFYTSEINIPPKAGDEVARVLINATGPHPDVDLQPRLPYFIAVRETWDVTEWIYKCIRAVYVILLMFGEPQT